ncbi:MAG: YggS family pyridoxal phosphate-dependent enzyme [Tissierellia bacterium]|nr:YggS family pyridoxal phosphate-dependent enzyme [Tissierellia bacterium]
MIKENIQALVNEIQSVSGDRLVHLIAVSKTKTIEEIQEAIAAGITDIGENKVQELNQKQLALGDAVRYHMIGHLQTNKVRNVIGTVELIHSVDRSSLIEEIEKRGKAKGIVQDVLLQLNIAKEDTKSGAYEEDLPGLIELIETKEYIRVKGLMTVAPICENLENVRPVFRKMKEIFDQLALMHYNNIEMVYLSMGMSHDFKAALEEGSNMIRVGSYIFGDRNY